MPELPEVQALVTDLATRLVGTRIDAFEVMSFSALKTFDPPTTALAGETIMGVQRHGKFLDIETGSEHPLHLVFHLARAGWVRWWAAPPPAPSKSGKGALTARLSLGDSGFDITEAGTKKSVAIYVVNDVLQVPGIARLGPDALSPGFTEQVFAGILHDAGRAQIKGVLRNQSLIAGIGNAYSDEILHTAKMSPFKPAAMPMDDASRLYEALQLTLHTAVAASSGLAAADLKRTKKLSMQVHGRTGEACPVCGDTVREVIFADSTLQYCPTCQTGGKPLADRVLSRLLK
jgi:formamidopyrimidine-DNA glycosylase